MELRLTTDMNMGFEGPRATARTLMKEGDTLFVALSWSEHPRAEDLRGGLRAARLDGAPLAALARPRQLPRPPLAHPPPAGGAHAQGAVLRAHRARSWRPRPPRCRRRPGGERNWDYRYTLDPRLHVHALGPLHARLRLGGQRLLLLHRRHRGGGGRRPPDHVRDRRRGRDPRVHARPPVRLRGRAAGAGRQRRLQAGPARRLGRAARLDLPAHEVAQLPAGARSGRSSSSRSRRRSRTGASPTAASGRSAASRSTSPRRS